MRRRQTSIPGQWLIADARSGAPSQVLAAARRLPRGSGILLLHHALPTGQRERLKRALRQLARSRDLVLLDEMHRSAARVHRASELARAQLAGAQLLLLSPMHATRSHPHWAPLPRMRAATLLRRSRKPVLALGGMDSKRFQRLRPLGFQGWAGIGAWIRT